MLLFTLELKALNFVKKIKFVEENLTRGEGEEEDENFWTHDLLKFFCVFSSVLIFSRYLHCENQISLI